MMFKLAMLGAAILLLSGCASTAGTFFNRPVVENDVGQVVHTVSLAADRRTLIVAPRYNDPVRLCAEPPPDTASALKTDLDTLAKVKSDEAHLKDKFETTVTVLSARNAPLDAFRTGVYALCQFWMNGAMLSADVNRHFDKLMTTFESTQKATAAAAAAVEQAKKPSETTAQR